MSSSAIVRRYEGNPILAVKDVPYDCQHMCNSAPVVTDDGWAMVLRIDQEGRQFLGLARSEDGLKWTVAPEPFMTPEGAEEDRIYDPHVTRIDGEYVVTYASDTSVGIRMGIAVTKDFRTAKRKHFSEPDNRDAVVFPEKINGLYCRLDRPFVRIYEKERPYDIWISFSPDLRYWGDHSLLLRWQDVYWGTHKIGPGPPPIRTDDGWLVIFHGSEMRDPGPEGWAKTYRAGVMLLDLQDPTKIVGRCEDPILEPEDKYPYEVEGYRPRVIFPTGLIDMGDGTCRIYYGASDQVMAVATASIADLVELCG